ncbi:MAG TPA: hypothetical protein VMV47_10760 [Bacteroidales bacterium]|nr:hypothetical protein [Bacteroidales bacterium]
MHLKKIISALFVSAVIMFLLGSCAMKTTTIEPYLIKIDSLHAPDTVNVKTLFTIEIYGYVGPSKCYMFEKAYNHTNDQNEITIEAWGRYAYYGDPCEEGIIMMDHNVELTVSSPGKYVIKGVQANGYFAEKNLVVK